MYRFFLPHGHINVITYHTKPDRPIRTRQVSKKMRVVVLSLLLASLTDVALAAKVKKKSAAEMEEQDDDEGVPERYRDDPRYKVKHSSRRHPVTKNMLSVFLYVKRRNPKKSRYKAKNMSPIKLCASWHRMDSIERGVVVVPPLKISRAPKVCSFIAGVLTRGWRALLKRG